MVYKIYKRGYILNDLNGTQTDSNLAAGNKMRVQKNIFDDIINAIDGFELTMTTYSVKWKNWIAQLDLKTCIDCRRLHGKIFPTDEVLYVEPPLHDFCRCEVKQLIAVYPGYATRDGLDGADYWLKYFGSLPECYITKQEAKESGWQAFRGNLDTVAPGKIIGGDVYENRNGHLPKAEGRIWYEADINYSWGYRGTERILFSSDGLIFVTYNHYLTFQEII